MDMHGIKCGSFDVPGYFSPAQAQAGSCHWSMDFFLLFLKIGNGTNHALLIFMSSWH